jgi:hypothetical protein
MNVFIPPNMAIVNTKEVFMVFDVKLSSSQFKDICVMQTPQSATLQSHGNLDVSHYQTVLTDDRANPAHLFCVGQKINFEGHDESFTVRGITLTNNRLVLTIDPALPFVVNATNYVYINSNITDGDLH